MDGGGLWAGIPIQPQRPVETYRLLEKLEVGGGEF